MEYTIAGIPGQPLDDAHYIEYKGIRLAVIAVVPSVHLAKHVLITSIETGWHHVVVLNTDDDPETE